MSVMPDMPDMKAYLSYAWYVSILDLDKARAGKIRMVKMVDQRMKKESQSSTFLLAIREFLIQFQ